MPPSRPAFNEWDPKSRIANVEMAVARVEATCTLMAGNHGAALDDITHKLDSMNLAMVMLADRVRELQDQAREEDRLFKRVDVALKTLPLWAPLLVMLGSLVANWLAK